MPSQRPSSKRTLEEIVQAENSSDEDYDDRAAGPSKSQRPRSRRPGGPTRKKPKRGKYRGSEISDDDGVETEDDVWTEEEEEEEIETNERGRPVRKSAKKAIRYEESDEDELSRSTSEEEVRRPSKSRTKIVKLKLTTPLPPANTRSRRPRSGSFGINSSAKPPNPPSAMRRSSRISRDDEEPVVALSSSGRHVDIIRSGSRDPEAPMRIDKGGKGIKRPSRSMIVEDEEPESTAEKEEEDEAEGELEIGPSQPEVDEPGEDDNAIDVVPPLTAASETVLENLATETVKVPQILNEEQAENDEEDEGPVQRSRNLRSLAKRKADSPPVGEPDPSRRRLRSRGRNTNNTRNRAPDESSDFNPEGEPEDNDDMSESHASDASPQKRTDALAEEEVSVAGRRSTRQRSKVASQQASASGDEEFAQEIAEELADLRKDGKRKRPSREDLVFEPRTRRGVKKQNYDLMRNVMPIEEEEEAAPSPSQRERKRAGGGWQRSLFSTYGPFGGAGGLAPVLGGPMRPAGEADSDSSDDEIMKQPKQVGGTVGMTPTTATANFNPFALQPINTDPAQGPAGTPANLGKVKDKQALADADPLGVDQHVNFDSVGGLEGHIDQLKEMVALPLLYPEIFMRFKITPPRGVLFHGPPGTGKTLLARALATSVSSHGKKVTFYMRKGADALSKWVGEAERQLRLLFDEARKNQPSIIFFDEIDGLAPVRSSKQEQIHASIVSTLLALMDGMDGRGQVIVIGATNRPDSIDPALRRPGRFDREFYFPLPDTQARRAIIDIHTRGWSPPLNPDVKAELAELTKGYGGADLRALCTEAALNAVQRRYPQIYRAKEKLLIDPKTIEVTPKDFMISIKKMTPSSERSASSGAASLPPSIQPLLQRALSEVERIVDDIMPPKKKTTALEEAQYEDVADGRGFGRERMQQAFESSRVFRPRLLIHGKFGMGQQYVAAALLHRFQGLHVQSFDLPTLLSDTSSSPEATLIRLFSEVKMHKPSVVYISNVREWFQNVGSVVLSTFFGLLRSIKPTDPVLVLGVFEGDPDSDDEAMRRELFGYSKRNQYQLESPRQVERLEFFRPLKAYIVTAPTDFPDPTNRKKRQLEVLKPAPPEPEKAPPPPTKEEIKAQKRRDRQTLNMLKIRLQPIMDQIRTRHKKFRTGVIEESQIRYLYAEADPGTVTSDIPTMNVHASFRPYEVDKDSHGVPGLTDQATGKFYYNLDSVTIEKRLSNGFYKRPKDFLADIKRLAKDAKTIGDEDRLLKANELLANVEVDISSIEFGEPVMTAECERVYQRELAREKEVMEKAKATQNGDSSSMPPPQMISNVPHNPDLAPSTMTTTDASGPIVLGEALPTAKDMLGRAMPVTPSRAPSYGTNLTNGVHTSHGARAPDSDHRSASNHTGSGHEGDVTGSGHEADVEGETMLGGTDSHPTSHEHNSNKTQETHTTSSFGNRESAQPRPFHSWTAPSQQLRREAGMSAPLSQSDYVTPMAPGSQAADYQNEASTTQTSSEKKNSGPKEQNGNTQESGPNLYLYDERHSGGGIDVPDTQENPLYSQGSVNGSSQSQRYMHAISSQGNYPASRRPSNPHTMPQTPDLAGGFHTSPPSHRPSGGASGVGGSHQLANLLNPQQPPNLVLPEAGHLENAIVDMADKASGLSVEQLEQVNSVLMDTIWRTRGQWNRKDVLKRVAEAFHEVLEDMKDAGQELGPLSWEGFTSRRIES